MLNQLKIHKKVHKTFKKRANISLRRKHFSPFKIRFQFLN